MTVGMFRTVTGSGFASLTVRALQATTASVAFTLVTFVKGRLLEPQRCAFCNDKRQLLKWNQSLW